MTKWRSIDTAPKNGVPVLLCVQNEGGGRGLIVAQHIARPDGSAMWAIGRHSCGGMGVLGIEATHWMPLPEPPK